MRDDRVVIAGSSGLIGSALTRSLQADGIEVTRLVRRPARSTDEVQWQPDTTDLDPEVLAGATAVVNLCGASIAHLPWTSTYRTTLAASRLQPTMRLAQAIHALADDAPQFVSASAVGFYGNRPGETLTETSTAGDSYLAELSADWERAALAAGPGARVALLRTASVLHPQAVLKPLLLLTRAGVSGPLGGGEQVWPWISLDDEVRAIRHIIDHGLTGPVNLAGPVPASANDIGRDLARRLHRPFVLPAPAWALRLALGRDAAESLLLADATVTPQVLIDTGFTFVHETASEAIGAALA